MESWSGGCHAVCGSALGFQSPHEEAQLRVVGALGDLHKPSGGVLSRLGGAELAGEGWVGWCVPERAAAGGR